MPVEISKGVYVPTIGDIADQMAGVYSEFVEVPAALEIPRHDWTPEPPAPGLYFGMGEDYYHAIPAFNVTGAKKLRASPTDYWADSWLCEENKPDPEKADEEEKAHRIAGKAYHAMILEGRAAYEERFYPMPSRDDHPNALQTVEAVKDAITKLGETPVGRVEDGKGGMRAAKKGDWVAQLMRLNPRAQVWDDIVERARRRAAGRALIPMADHLRISMAYRMIQLQPDLAKAVNGGYPEVVAIWIDSRQGVLKKARFDYLKLKAVIDLKSYSGKGRNISARKACAREISDFGYFLQPAHYLEGLDHIKALIRQYGASVIHSADEVAPEVHAARRDFAIRMASYQGEVRWLWVFQKTGKSPITRGLWHPLAGSRAAMAESIMADATRTFRSLCETYGTEMWLDIEPVDDLLEDEIPLWGYDI